MARTTTSPSKSSRRLLRLVAIVVAVLLASEVGARVLEPRMPDTPDFHTVEADIKDLQMRRIGADGGADVVILGSSITGAGIDTEALGEELDVVAYDGGLASASPELLLRWATDVVLPTLHPQIVVIGTSSLFVADTAGGDPFVAAYEESYAAKVAEGSASVLDRVNHQIGQRSVLWDHRGQLVDPNTLIDVLKGNVKPDWWAAGLGPTGSNHAVEDLSLADGPTHNGLPLESFAVGTKNVDALRALLTEIRVAGATPVLLQMPASLTYVQQHPHGSDDYQKYLDVLAEVADELDVPLITSSPQLDWVTVGAQNRYFADLSHLNAAGRTILTDQLADELKNIDPGL